MVVYLPSLDEVTALKQTGVVKHEDVLKVLHTQSLVDSLGKLTVSLPASSLHSLVSIHMAVGHYLHKWLPDSLVEERGKGLVNSSELAWIHSLSKFQNLNIIYCPPNFIISIFCCIVSSTNQTVLRMMASWQNIQNQVGLHRILSLINTDSRNIAMDPCYIGLRYSSNCFCLLSHLYHPLCWRVKALESTPHTHASLPPPSPQ